MNKTRKIKKFPIDISKDLQKTMTNTGNLGNDLYVKKLIFDKSNVKEVNVTWDFENLKQGILSKISPRLYSWYHENTSSAGDSTFAAINSYLQYRFLPNYLNPKPFSINKEITLHSTDLGITKINSIIPFFTAPYGCASEYGGKSNEISTMLGTVKGGGIYTMACFGEYTIEYLYDILKKNTKEQNPFFMYQLYLTGDNDINISLIERIKEHNPAVLIITIDTGRSNNHGGIGLLENKSDLTFGKKIAGTLLTDIVFNIKCYQKHNCVGTKDTTVLNKVSNYLSIPVSKLLSSYNEISSFDYAKHIQGGGMGNVYATENPNDTLGLKHIVKIAHSKKSLCKYVQRKITKGIPLVFKGCISIPVALEIQKSGADGVYVSNHGGRFVYNSIPPLDILTDIRDSVKKKDNNFGVWFDGGIRRGSDILTAYSKGAEFVGLGRPIIYACVLYGEPGVSSITKKFQFELQSQCDICGIDDLNNYNKIKNITIKK